MSHPCQEKLLIIGGGMSGTKFALELAKKENVFQTTVLSDEPQLGYNRIMLSPVLAGEKRFEDILLSSKEEFNDLNINFKTSSFVKEIDINSRYATTDNNERFDYDKLVIATGSLPFILPIKNHQADGVVAFRNKSDIDTMLSLVHSGKRRCIVIGGGLLGLEAANALNKQGAEVTVVHISDCILERQLNNKAAKLLQEKFEKQGIEFKLQAFSQEILIDRDNQVRGLLFKDGSCLDADMIVMAVGVRPNIDLAKNSGLDCQRGIVVNEKMQTSHSDVYAIGECVQFQEQLFGLVAPVYEQANVLINNLCGTEDSYFVKPVATKLKVSGINLFSAGDVRFNEHHEYLEFEDNQNKIYKRLAIENDKLVNAVLYGDVNDGAWFFDLINQGKNIKHLRASLLFGQHYCQLLETQ